jgi:hypothetical protein
MEHITTLLRSLNDDFGALMSNIAEFADDTAVEAARDTNKDQVLRALVPILANRVGPALDEHSYAQAVTEGMRRVEAREPPGYMDKKKNDTGAAGDYLVWLQVLLETEKRHCDVLFVTGDVKEGGARSTVSGGARALSLSMKCADVPGHSYSCFDQPSCSTMREQHWRLRSGKNRCRT